MLKLFSSKISVKQKLKVTTALTLSGGAVVLSNMLTVIRNWIVFISYLRFFGGGFHTSVQLN